MYLKTHRARDDLANGGNRSFELHSQPPLARNPLQTSRMPKSRAGDATSDLSAVKAGLAQMLKGGVMIDVVDAEQARIAEEAGACAVMALGRCDPQTIEEIMRAVTIPVIAKARIGGFAGFAKGQVLQAAGVDSIDERKALMPADATHRVHKHGINGPFMRGYKSLADLQKTATALDCDLELLQSKATLRRLPVVNFVVGGIATPADAAMMMHMGCDAVFVRSGIFESGSSNATKRAKAIVQATVHY